MRLTCPGCGAIASLEAFANDTAARKVANLFGQIPSEVATVLPEYLAMFRPEKQGLRWSRVQSILEELAPMIRQGFARNGRRYNPAARTWVEGITQTGNRGLRRPLKSHGYLLEVVADLHDRAEGKWERERDEEQRKGNKPPPRPVSKPKSIAAEQIDVHAFYLEQGIIDQAEFDRQRAKVIAQYGEP